jgi:hypothetical protein
LTKRLVNKYWARRLDTQSADQTSHPISNSRIQLSNETCFSPHHHLSTVGDSNIISLKAVTSHQAKYRNQFALRNKSKIKKEAKIFKFNPILKLGE